MASYGSVLPPAAPSAGAAVAPSSAPIPPATGSGGVSGGATGLVPISVRRESGRIERDDTERDIEIARRAVSELAGPASIEAAGTEWAVAVGYTRHQHRQTLWVATNDGMSYLPPGVYLRKGHRISAGDQDFNSRWCGWWCPAETAVRAGIEDGDYVTAVATTQMHWPNRKSEILDDPDLDVEYAVPHGGLHTDACELTSRRMHRLQTVSSNYWRLHEELASAGRSRSWEFCRGLTDRLAFGLDEGELSPTALAAARQLVGSRAPTEQQWADLRGEYELARIQAAAMRPGLDGIERPEQTASYRRDFTIARRLETLIRWSARTFDPSDIVYAAIAASASITDEVLTPLAVV
jgi:hypothetical protein